MSVAEPSTSTTVLPTLTLPEVGEEPSLSCLRKAALYAIEVAGLLRGADIVDEELEEEVYQLLALWAKGLDTAYVDGLAYYASLKERNAIEALALLEDRAEGVMEALESGDCEAAREALLLLVDALGVREEGLRFVLELVEKGSCSELRAAAVALLLVPPRTSV